MAWLFRMRGPISSSEWSLGIGRSKTGMRFGPAKELVHLIFLFGVPKRMVTDYLVCVGAVARVVKDKAKREEALMAATRRRSSSNSTLLASSVRACVASSWKVAMLIRLQIAAYVLALLRFLQETCSRPVERAAFRLRSGC